MADTEVPPQTRRTLIRSPRIELRPIEDAHAPWLLAMLLPHRAQLVPRVWWASLLKTETDALWLCESWRQQWDRGEQFTFAVHDHDQKFLGIVMLVRTAPRDLASGGAELGMLFDPAVRGQGLATEATRAILRWGFESLGLHRVHGVAPLEDGNTSRYFLRLGFTPEGVARDAEWVGGRHWSVVTYGLLAREAKASLAAPFTRSAPPDRPPSIPPPPPLPSSIVERVLMRSQE